MDSDAEYPLGEEESEPDHPSPSEMKYEEAEPLPKISTAEDYDLGSDRLPSSEVETDTASEDDDNERFSLKRPAEEALTPRAFKRHKGVLNTDYLDLLNVDIEDAAHRVCLSGDADIKPSQLGLTSWSATEKNLFFEAMSRLGRDDLPGIASRIGTKSEIEVRHYLSVLEGTQLIRQREGLRPEIDFPEYPAAVELSQQLCHALDEAADAVSVRQERKEEQREENKWGDCWDVTPRLARKLDTGEQIAEGQEAAFAGVLISRNWLRLSERIFMNSSIPSDNWSFIENHPPSMWATTFEDFHSLAVSITRRLVQTTIFMSMSRIRAKRDLRPQTRNIVRLQDAEAAIASLSMSRNSNDFWLKCARRLRLEVHEEPPDRDRDEEVELEPLSYDEVENLLAGNDSQVVEKAPEEEELLELCGDNIMDDYILDDHILDDSDFEAPFNLSDDEEYAINQEANEVLQYSAADFPETHRTKQSLKSRVATERKQEQYAEDCDEYASYQAEADMWELLQKKPPMELPKVHEPEPVPRSKLDVETIYPLGRDWRRKIGYRSEWEADEGLETTQDA
ncbi:hypothetical protein AK830_g10144 [Neonectria ditissima]|uniref:Myb-like domain-containing protein n=1 Tax=Neonectria ditissima TaxID=78410 RepID=A0A0P7B7E1_9HYPO|nr:hypothetical protein AK830_g10144 [Neonectria ditissima]